MAEESQARHDRPDSPFAKSTKRLTPNRITDVPDEVDVLFASTTGCDSSVDFAKPIQSFTTRRALTTGFVMVKVNQAMRDLEDIRCFIEDN